MPGDIPLIDVVVFVSSAHTTGEDNSKKLKNRRKNIIQSWNKETLSSFSHFRIRGHIRIRIHGINLIILYIVWFCQIYLSVFRTEMIIYNNGSIDIAETF